MLRLVGRFRLLSVSRLVLILRERWDGRARVERFDDDRFAGGSGFVILRWNFLTRRRRTMSRQMFCPLIIFSDGWVVGGFRREETP